jgi:hypothetical protein
MCNKTSKTIEYCKIFLRWIIKRAHGMSRDALRCGVCFWTSKQKNDRGCERNKCTGAFISFHTLYHLCIQPKRPLTRDFSSRARRFRVVTHSCRFGLESSRVWTSAFSGRVYVILHRRLRFFSVRSSCFQDAYVRADKVRARAQYGMNVYFEISSTKTVS